VSLVVLAEGRLGVLVLGAEEEEVIVRTCMVVPSFMYRYGWYKGGHV